MNNSDSNQPTQPQPPQSSQPQQPQYPPQYQQQPPAGYQPPPGYQMPPAPGYPPYPQYAQALPPPPKRRAPVKLLVILGFFTICGVLAVAVSSRGGGTPSDSSASNSTGVGRVVNGTPAIAVEAPSYADWKGKHTSMTDAQWAIYIKTEDGTHITKWDGNVMDVQKQSGSNLYDLSVEMDGEIHSLSSSDVSITIPEADATKFNKGQKISFNGTINHISCSMGFCQVIVDSAQVTSR